MTLTKLKTIDVKGKKFQVSISDNGEFFAEYEQEQVKAESLAKLTSKLQSRLARSKRVNIRVCYWDYDSWSDRPGKVLTGAIVGIHASNNNLLLQWDGEKGGSEQVGGGRNFFDPGKAKELAMLGEALNAAQKTFDDFIEKHHIDARAKVQEALGEVPDAEE